jgi:hypothetical protein
MGKTSTKGCNDNTADLDIFLDDIENELGSLHTAVIQQIPLKSLLKDKGGLEYEDRIFAINLALEKLTLLMASLSKIHKRFATKNHCTYVGLNFSPDKRPVHDMHKLIPDGLESLKYEYGPLLCCNNRMFWRMNPSLIAALREQGVDTKLWTNKQIEVFDPDCPMAAVTRNAIFACAPDYYRVMQVLDHARMQVNLTYMTLGNWGRALLKIATQQRRQHLVDTALQVEKLERASNAIYNRVDPTGQCTNIIQRVFDIATITARESAQPVGRAAPSPIAASQSASDRALQREADHS